MIRLIINADDLGSGVETDRGIFETFEKGRVTSASLLPNGPSFSTAARACRKTGLPVGVHLNLSEGRSITGPVSGLTDAAGNFPGKMELRHILASRPPESAGLLRELSAQVEKVMNAGLRPDHLDTHQHFFLFPSVTPIVLDVARSFGVKALRLPSPVETTPPPHSLTREEFDFYRRMAPSAGEALRQGGFFAPDGLLGMSLLNRLDEESLVSIFSDLSSGTWEIMVHPGYEDPQNPFSGPERVQEMSALLCRGVGEFIQSRDIRLIHFGDLLCAS